MSYDLSEAFEAIEDELIGSMMRNLRRHQAEETDQGFEWAQWQALQLQALEDYRKRNLKKFPPRFRKLNLQIDELLKTSYSDGRTAQERKILEAIRNGFNAPPSPFSGEAVIEGTFFQVNDRKLDALIEATTHDMERAEYAILRRADDQYRQVIFNAQVYANTGAGTYKKAVDMATRDFLRAGLDCVEYRDGSRHTLEDYADMAIRTANKRAYLQGEGSMRDEWDVPTVIMNKRNCPCPRCAPFVGKVFIDDVWSGGSKDGISPVTGIKYPLLSDAIAQGLYHPRCKDVHTTYFEGISTPPEGSQYTADELDAMAEKYDAQQKQCYCERQEKRYSRISKYSLDEDNQRMYGARAKEWGEKAQEFKKLSDSIATSDKKAVETVEKSGESGIIESERMKHSMEYAVPKDLLTTRSFREKFYKMDSDPEIQQEFYKMAKEILTHRSGNNGEDLAYYNIRTGKWFVSKTGTEAGIPEYNADILRGLKESRRGEIISFHNHPTGMPPSDSDLNAALINGYKKGYTLGHNGVIFEYTPPKQKIPESNYLTFVEKYKKQGFSEFESQLFALKDLSPLYEFEFREVI